MVLKRSFFQNTQDIVLENDVKMYGTQTKKVTVKKIATFENDVKMYGTQTII